MLKSWLSATIVISNILAIATIKPLQILALEPLEIDAIAKQTTVVIAESLQKGEVESGEAFDPGSGVIIGKNGNTYYVLTALHVVRTRGITYGVRTFDGDVYAVDDEKTKTNIVQLGEEKGDRIKDFDLAIIKFESKKDYPIAVLGNSQQLKSADKLYISGWPYPDPDIKAPGRERKFSEGKLTDIKSNPIDDGGYSILYDNWTRVGMSGGPVFNSEGEVIGIHGRGRSKEGKFCVDPQLNINNSCGMQSIHFKMFPPVLQLHLPLVPPPVNPTIITSGKKAPITADKIDNIYKAFSNLRTRLKDCNPALLLGDDEDECKK
jgi:serine protease Do